MAIMSGIEGEIEVRVKKHPGKYYDEYAKLKPSERSPNPHDERYIMAEPKATYYVEITLKEGFDFGKYDLIQAKMCMDGKEVSYAEFKMPLHGINKTKTEKDLVQTIRYANVEIHGRPRGSKFVFRNVEMETDEEQSNDTGAVDTLPKGIPAFQVDVVFFESFMVTLSDDEYKEVIISWKKNCARLFSEPQNSNASPNLTLPRKPDRTRKDWRCVHCMEGFKFFPRPAEFFENDNIAKYPVLLHVYDWDALKREERKMAVAHLQDLEKTHWKAIKGNEVGQNFGSKVNRRKTHLAKNLPREWRAWHKMYGTEQRETFDILQERRKARERGEKNFQYTSMGGDVMLFNGEDESAKLGGVPEKVSPNQIPAGREALAPSNSPSDGNRLGLAGALAYSSPYPIKDVAESVGDATSLNMRLPLAIESPVVIPDDSATESAHSNITTPHRNKTVIPGVEVKLESIRDSLISQIDRLNSQAAASQTSAAYVKAEPIDVISLDSDDEVMFVSETKVFKTLRRSEPVRATKPLVVNVDEDLQELKELQKLREEKENLQRDIELLEKKRKMDEITKKIEDAEAKAKRIKTE
ncbi:hypothetical protein BELL_0358g00090 [Botrytis elliptica]|uniref:DUF7918 domain-containing protein n=1 Tax=Botrytis elliptica TaxID=278938 RepID=A0A4Z1JJH6_9HELO|nr:hypothetical protein EAE99_003428 [Botrytis elliptica]TGO73474.1 hypothetical protein BELL_0358g00090 [Botrytis elliptica]